MGDVRFLTQYERVRRAPTPTAALGAMSDEEVIAALAGASMTSDPYLANVLATEAQNRARAKETIVCIAGEGLVALHPDGALRFLNPAAEEVLGYSQKELLGVNFHDAVHRDAAGAATPWPSCPVCTEVLHRGKALRDAEATFRRKDGSLFPATLTVSPILREGEVEGAILLFRDVTEAKRAQARLMDSEERYRSLFVHNPDAVYSFDLEGTFLSANPALERMSGYALEELARLTFLPLVDPPDRERVLHHFRKAAQGEPQLYEATLLRRDGERLSVEVTNVPMTSGGQVVGVYGIAKDVTPRKRAEAALRYHTSLLEAQNEASVDGILVVDADGRMVTWNRRFVDIWGFPATVTEGRADEDARRHARSLVADPEWFHASIVEAYERRPPAMHDEVLLRDGRILDRHGARVTGPDGTYYGWVWTFRDVTQRRRTEEALRQSEERLRLLVESAVDYALYALDAEGRVASWNPGAQRLTGYRMDEILGRHFSVFFDEADRARGEPEAELEAALRDGLHRQEAWRVRKDGTRFWAEVSVSPLREGGGRHAGFAKVTRDLSERKCLEDALREREARFRALYDEIPVMYFTLAPDGTILTANRYGARYLGYEPRELEGRPATDLLHPDDRALAQRNFSEMLRTRPPLAEWTFRKVTKAGEVLWVRDTVRLAQDPQGRDVLLNVCEDVTERRRRDATLATFRREPATEV